MIFQGTGNARPFLLRISCAGGVCCMPMPSSERWGNTDQEYGKYPVKIYTVDRVLIYQDELGGDNTDKTPKGGVIVQGSAASSMIGAITNPITFYGNGKVISQDGHSGDLYNYYWTSYSRGTDGKVNSSIWAGEPQWHNVYLDGYVPLRVKSIYDPCPYLYRIPSNGTYNQFANTGWTAFSYLGGVSWNINALGEIWLTGLGVRNSGLSVFFDMGRCGYYFSSTPSGHINGYVLGFLHAKTIYTNRDYSRSLGNPVRCIDLAQYDRI